MNPYALFVGSVVTGCGLALAWDAFTRWLARRDAALDRLISDALDERPPLPRRVVTTAEWERLKSTQAQARADIEDEREFFAWAEWQVRP